MNIYILVPVFNNLNLTKLFLESVRGMKNLRIIIIDDNPSKLHKSLDDYENIDLVFGDGTNYWGGSINLGISYLESRYFLNDSDLIIIANNDIIIDFKLKNLVNSKLDFQNSVYHVQVRDEKLNYIKSCGRIKSWFPFIQEYPRGFKEKFKEVDTLTGRFLLLTWLQLKSVGGIDSKLPHYGGDSDLGLKLKSKNYKSYLLRDFSCVVNKEQTGLFENARINQLISLLTDIKSSFCVRYKWVFVRNHNNYLFSLLIIISIYLKLIVIIVKNHLK